MTLNKIVTSCFFVTVKRKRKRWSSKSFINSQAKSPTTITNIHDCTKFDLITLHVPMIRKQCLTLKKIGFFSEGCFNSVVSSQT